MQPNPLALPVGALMRASDTLRPEDSLATAAAKLQENMAGLVPVVSGPFLQGMVTEASMARALADSALPSDPVSLGLQPAATVLAHASGAEALRALNRHEAGTLLVIDGDGRFLGLLSASDLYPRPPRRLRPPLVGGMATPFGVYLTTGTISAGASGLALVATGASLFTLFLVSSLLSEYVSGLFHQSLSSTLFVPLQMAFFFLAMRMLPISGIHGAEHKVVHAIEREEELVPEVVARMPRVHPRCGTNVAAGASIFLGLGGAQWIPDQQLRLLLAAVATLALWRPVGSVLQYYVTTRPPSRKHLEMGIRSANELLEKYRLAGSPRSSFARRIWNSGMLHVMAGSTLCYLVAAALVKLFNLPIQL